MQDYIITSDGELRHYGVLGMKWGHRKARKNVSKAKTARDSAKEWDEMADYAEKKGKTKRANKYRQNAAQDRADAKSYEQKAKRIEQKHIQRAGGKKAYDYSAKESTGKSVVKSMLLGTYGALRYNEARSKGAVRGKALVDGILAGGFSRLTLGVGGIVEPRLREDKNKARIRRARDYVFKD